MFFAWWPPTLGFSLFLASPWGPWPSAKGLAFSFFGRAELPPRRALLFRPFASLLLARRAPLEPPRHGLAERRAPWLGHCAC